MQHLTDSAAAGVGLEPLMLAEQSEAAGTLSVTAPFDQQVIAEVETCDLAHVDGALRVAHKLFRNRDSWISLADRIEILERTVHRRRAASTRRQ